VERVYAAAAGDSHHHAETGPDPTITATTGDAVMDPTGPVARRFPLVARSRPACLPLPQRTAYLRGQAAAAAHHHDAAAATTVFNLAALVASDCGLPDLARHWCHRLAHAALRRQPSNDPLAIRSLEPIVNLARLRTRAGDGLGAWSLLENLFQTVASRTDTVIDGIEVPAARLTGPPETHRQVCAWLWAVLLSDGARALVAAGRWDEARRRLDHYRGIGHRILDGRQISVIAHATAGNHDQALALLHATEPGQPWEDAVTACLTLLCQPQPTTTADARGPVAAYVVLDTTTTGLAVFRTRLGLSLIDALAATNPAAGHSIAGRLLDQGTTDGYVARDLLAHSGCRYVATSRQTHALAGIVRACGLDDGHMAAPQLAEITKALNIAEQVLRDNPTTGHSLGTRRPSVGREIKLAPG
jgi:hypothetical protein